MRDRVFAELAKFDFRVDCTILDKRKTHPALAADEVRFYQRAWLMHLRFLAPQITTPGDELLVVAASLGTKRKRQGFENALRNAGERTLLERRAAHNRG